MPAQPADKPEIKTQGDTKGVKIQTGNSGGGFSSANQPKIEDVKTEGGAKATAKKGGIEIEFPTKNILAETAQQLGALSSVLEASAISRAVTSSIGKPSEPTPGAVSDTGKEVETPGPAPESTPDNGDVGETALPTTPTPQQAPAGPTPEKSAEPPQPPSATPTTEPTKPTETTPPAAPASTTPPGGAPPAAPTAEQLKNVGPSAPPTISPEQQASGDVGSRGEQTGGIGNKIGRLANAPITTPPPAAPSTATPPGGAPPAAGNPQEAAADMQSGQAKQKRSILQKIKDKKTAIQATALAEGAAKIPTIGPFLEIILTILVGIMQLVEMLFGEEGGALFAEWVIASFVFSVQINLFLPIFAPFTPLVAPLITAPMVPIIHAVTYKKYTRPYIQAFRKRYAVSPSRLTGKGGNIAKASKTTAAASEAAGTAK